MSRPHISGKEIDERFFYDKAINLGEDTDNGWINSSGHCSNIMDPKFKEIGVAKVGDYWTLVFGAH